MKHSTRSNTEGDGASGRIATNLRMLLMLETLGKADQAMSPTEINLGLGLPKQSIHRLCATLVAEGFLVYDLTGRKLRPARRLREIAANILHSPYAHIARHQILEEVAERIGETVNFVVPEEKGMRYRDRVDTDWPFRVQLPIGTRVPFHCTASGKVYLAGLPNTKREALISALRLERHTPRTLTSTNPLLAELEQIVRQGYALDREEFIDGMIAIAVPVADGDGRFIASLAVHGPTVRLDEAKLLSHRHYLADTASRLARILLED